MPGSMLSSPFTKTIAMLDANGNGQNAPSRSTLAAPAGHGENRAVTGFLGEDGTVGPSIDDG
jgi:hypothetical protein